MVPAISIIIPVFKAENYIHKCIDSIINQTFTNFEVLLINDGSPDNSGFICDKYSKADCRFKTFHKSNGGVCSARQFGLDQSIGKYVIHVDPDDWVEPDYLETMYSKAEETNSDMVICDFWLEEKDKQTYYSQEPKSLDHISVFREFLGKLYASCWNKLIKRNCFSKYNINFPMNMSLWEDGYVNGMLTLNKIKISYVNKALYHYDFVTNENSIVRKVTRNAIESKIFFIKHFEKLCGKTEYFEELYAKKLSTKIDIFLNESYSRDEYLKVFPETHTELIKRMFFLKDNSMTKAFMVLYILGYKEAKQMYWEVLKHRKQLINK